MSDIKQVALDFIDAYNAKDFQKMTDLVEEDIDFAHYNRGYRKTKWSEMLALFPNFSDRLSPDRHFTQPTRITVGENLVIIESSFVGTANEDIPDWAKAGETYDFKLCTIFGFSENGKINEWKDHG